MATLKVTEEDSVRLDTGVTPSVVVVIGAIVVPVVEMERSATLEFAVVLVKSSDVPLIALELKPFSVPDQVPLAGSIALPVPPEFKPAKAATTSAWVIFPVAVSVNPPMDIVSPATIFAASKATLVDSVTPVTAVEPLVVVATGATTVPAVVVVELAKVEVADENPVLW